jgi:hypothetical protein
VSIERGGAENDDSATAIYGEEVVQVAHYDEQGGVEQNTEFSARVPVFKI